MKSNMPSISGVIKRYETGSWAVRVTTNRSKATDGFLVQVKITDARYVYGRIQCLASPLNGSGNAWVDQHKIIDLSTVEAGSALALVKDQ